jgi:hypothetical protein
MTDLLGAETIAANRYIYARLSAALAPVKVYPGVAPQGSTMPYVIYQYMPGPNTGDTQALGGVRVLVRLRYLVKAITSGLTAAEPLVKAIDLALQDTDGPQSGYYVGNVSRAAPFELPTVEDDELYWQTGGYYDLEVSAGL